MKFAITRWKLTPLKYGRFVIAPLLSFAAFVPRVNATKFATVPGASFSYNCAVIFPIDVLIIQYSPGGRSGSGSAAGAAFLAAGAVVVAAFLAGAGGGGVCANAPIVSNKRVASGF